MPAAIRPRFAIALISAAVLAYEVLLMALLSLIQWHHFAYLVVSIALLGFGLSGSLLAFYASRLQHRLRIFTAVQAGLFACTAPLGFALAQRLAFNPEQLIWDPGHWLRLALVMLLLMLPFFFAANLIGLALVACVRQQARIYAADLLGAGIGALAIIAAMYRMEPSAALRGVALIGVCAAAAGWIECRGRRATALVGLAAAALLLWLLPGAWIEPQVSAYKELSQLLRVPGTRLVAQRFSPLGRLSVVESAEIPLRHAPGLSLAATREPPPQLALFTNADAMTAITRYRGELAELAYLDAMTSALPYRLRRPGRVLILGAGGGDSVLQALYHRAAAVDAVELNPQVVELVDERLVDFNGGLFRQPNVRLHLAEARGFLQRGADRYDLIQVPLLDSFASTAGGVHGLRQNFVYTVEALRQSLGRLNPGGMIALTRWVRLPPRDSLKLFATAIAALRRSGAAPAPRLMLIRGLQTSTLLIKNGEFSAAEIARLKRFCGEYAFDLAYYPGIAAGDANRFNRLDAPYFYAGAQALLGAGAADFRERYKFNLEPASDDRPFHFHFSKWSTLPELLALRARGGGALIETGYLTLLVSLALALLLSLVLILAPLLLLRFRARGSAPRFGRARVLTYFTGLGLGFLLIEISFMQKFVLLLQHPLLAAAVVLSTFLLSAGAGSALAQRYAATRRAHRMLTRAVLLIICCCGLYLTALEPLLGLAGAWPLAPRVGLCVLLIVPLGFAMGMPFPLGLGAIRTGPAALTSWAWGINGCASVVSAVLASLLALHFGFNRVIMIAVVCYLLAAASFPQALPTARGGGARPDRDWK